MVFNATDPIRCMYGFTLAFWIKPETLPATKTYYFSSSAHGFNVYSEQNSMYSVIYIKALNIRILHYSSGFYIFAGY
jgi:hypothetical protein